MQPKPRRHSTAPMKWLRRIEQSDSQTTKDTHAYEGDGTYVLVYLALRNSFERSMTLGMVKQSINIA